MPLFTKGQVVAQRWQVLRRCGEGQFSEVYEVRDCTAGKDAMRWAMKVEKRKEMRSIKQEHKVIKRLQDACPQICPVVYGGQLPDERYYVIMELLGQNLVEARRSAGGGAGRYPPWAVRCIGLAMLDALQAVHAAGFIHRDVKPANFAQVPGTGEDGGVGEWRLVDFGLARRYLDESGHLIPPRPSSAFRGSTTYASIHAHAGSDLSRRDDLWSWLYVVTELVEGTLPWRPQEGTTGGKTVAAAGEAPSTSQRDAVAAIKQQCITNPALLAQQTPAATGALSSISTHLSSLSFEAKPDYGLLRAALAQLPDVWPLSSALMPPALDEPMQHQPPLQPHHQLQPMKVLIASEGRKHEELGVQAGNAGVREQHQAHFVLYPPSMLQNGNGTASHGAPHLGSTEGQQPLPPSLHPHSLPILEGQQGGNHYPEAGDEAVDGRAAKRIKLEEGQSTAVHGSNPSSGHKTRALPQQNAHVAERQGVGIHQHVTPELHQEVQEAAAAVAAQAAWDASGRQLNHWVAAAAGHEGTQHAAWGHSQHHGQGPKESLTGAQLSAAAQAEAAGVRNVFAAIETLRRGMAGSRAEALAAELSALHPADALAVISAVLGVAVLAAPPAAGAALGGMLRDVSFFAVHTAKRAEARYAVHAAAQGPGWQQWHESQPHPQQGNIDLQQSAPAFYAQGEPAAPPEQWSTGEHATWLSNEQGGQIHPQPSTQQQHLSQAVHVKQPTAPSRAPLYAVAAPAPRQQHHQQRAGKEGSVS